APVEVADFVPGVVLAVLGELDAVALVGAFMNAGEVSLDERASDQGKAAVTREGRGGDGGRHGGLGCLAADPVKRTSGLGADGEDDDISGSDFGVNRVRESLNELFADVAGVARDDDRGEGLWNLQS